MFYIVFEFKELFISLQPDDCLRRGLDQNVAIKMDKWFTLKNQNWILPTCDSLGRIEMCTLFRFAGSMQAIKKLSKPRRAM